MDSKTLSVVERKELKKGPAKRLRKEGFIPAVIYGRNEPVTIAVNAREFDRKFHNVSESTIITLELGKQNWDVLVKDFQDNPFIGTIDHIDFYEIERGKALKTNVPVHTDGNPIGVREGGILEVLSHELEIECLPKDLPEAITVDISELGLGSSIHVSEIKVPEGVKVLTPGEQVLALVSHKGAEEAVSEEEDLEEEAAVADGEE